MWGYEGVGWYASTIDGTAARPAKIQRLKFGRVNYHAKVWLNGELLGENANGYLPFEFDVTGKLRSDSANLLVLRVDNRPRLSWLPGAKQIEWIQYGGMLEPVTLETSPRIDICDLTVNVYQGSLAGKLAHHLGELDELVTGPSEEFIRRQLAAFPDKPLLITEFGARGVPGMHGDIVYSEDFQAACIQAAWKAIQNCEEASGGVLWSWADYYHRRTFVQYAVFGPYGVVTVDRRPKAALTALTRMYKGEQTR